MGSESEEKKEMLIINGNAFYEIDLECVKKKKQCAQTVHPEKKTDRINFLLAGGTFPLPLYILQDYNFVLIIHAA